MTSLRLRTFFYGFHVAYALKYCYPPPPPPPHPPTLYFNQSLLPHPPAHPNKCNSITLTRWFFSADYEPNVLEDK